MQRKPTPEELAQEALEFLEKAEQFEQEKNWSKAIQLYSEAAENLKSSGFLMHRIEDIYNRITELNNYVKQEQQYAQQTQQQQVQQLQEQAFALLDEAKELESNGRGRDAIDQYMSAINLLAQSGWTEQQLENIKNKIMVLAKKVEQQEKLQKQQELQYQQQQQQKPEMGTPAQQQPASSTPAIQEDPKAKALREFEEKKKNEEQIQNQAFSHIDNAKMFEKEKKYDEAILNYQKAIELLNSLGWTQQTKNLKSVVENLRREKQQHAMMQQKEVQQSQQTTSPSVTAQTGSQADIMKEEPQLEQQKLYEYEQKKQKEEEIQNEAFQLIDEGKRLEREKKFPEAIQSFQKAIKMLQSINWTSYIQPIYEFIERIKQKQQTEVKAEQIKEQREKELKELQTSIQKKQKDQFVESAQQLELKRKEFEKRKQEQVKRENDFLATLDKADELLNDMKFDGAISTYQEAINKLDNLGEGWQSYIPTIKNTINIIQKKKQQKLEREQQLKAKQQIREKQEKEYQTQLTTQLQAERKKLKQKEIVLKQRENELQYREKKKNAAFKYLDAAHNYLMQNEFDKAIYAYQNAGNIFAEIQWNDELAQIENAIKDVEKKRQEYQEQKEKQLEQKIKQKQEQKEFQRNIARMLQKERKEIKNRQIKIKEKEKQQAYFNERKEKAFDLIEKAQSYVTESKFEEALENYREVANIFAEIHWDEEIPVIQNAISDIKEKQHKLKIKEEQEKQKRILEQKQEKDFNFKITQLTKKHQEDLERQKLMLREREKEKQYRENRKQRAFKLIDKADEFLSRGEFDKSLKLYREVSNIFAQIQWTEEIPLIENSIMEIKKKKKEKQVKEARARQERIQQETEQLAFTNQIQQKRKIERQKQLEKQQKLQKEKQISEQITKQQAQALNLVEEGDRLLKQNNFDQAITNYQKAEEIFRKIGWSEAYLKTLEDSIDNIKLRKKEYEEQKQKEEELRKRREEEIKKFQQRIAKNLEEEKKRMKIKEIKVKKHEEMKKLVESKKGEAFELLDQAETLVKEKKYDSAMELYHKAELLLNEIQFPTDAIKEMKVKVQNQKKEEELRKQKEQEAVLRNQQEQMKFQQKVTKNINLKKEELRQKEIRLKKQQELQQYFEKRKNDAFNLLEEAEIFLKKGNYEKSLEVYHSAEMILNEIHFPTKAIKDQIQKVKEKKQQEELTRKQELEQRLQRKTAEKQFQQKKAEELKKEKARLKLKEIKLKKREEMQKFVETKKQEAFDLLDRAEKDVNSGEYEQALGSYRKAELILNEIQFPTDSVKEMIVKVENLKKQKQIEQERRLELQLEQIQEQKDLENIIEQRKREEEEKKRAQREALKKREELIAKQQNIRDASYSLLEEAGKFLKQYTPDYDKAISLYIQARNLLAENIGWEPEIKNLNNLIQNLQQEKEQFIKEKEKEKLAKIQQQEEYESFQQEIRQKQRKYEQQRQNQREKMQKLQEQQQKAEIIKKEGFELLDKAKKFTQYHKFEEAYEKYNKAKQKFREIGWNKQIGYIDKEIDNAKQVEQELQREKLEREQIEKELEQQRKLEEKRRQEEYQKIKQTVGEVGDLAKDVSHLIQKKQKEMELSEQQKQKRMIRESKAFRDNIGRMMRIKQELRTELEKAKQEEKKKQEEQEKKKQKAQIDEISKLLDDVGKD